MRNVKDTAEMTTDEIISMFNDGFKGSAQELDTEDLGFPMMEFLLAVDKRMNDERMNDERD